jgi:hypothetical protein
MIAELREDRDQPRSGAEIGVDRQMGPEAGTRLDAPAPPIPKARRWSLFARRDSVCPPTVFYLFTFQSSLPSSSGRRHSAAGAEAADNSLPRKPHIRPNGAGVVVNVGVGTATGISFLSYVSDQIWNVPMRNSRLRRRAAPLSNSSFPAVLSYYHRIIAAPAAPLGVRAPRTRNVEKRRVSSCSSGTT